MSETVFGDKTLEPSAPSVENPPPYGEESMLFTPVNLNDGPPKQEMSDSEKESIEKITDCMTCCCDITCVPCAICIGIFSIVWCPFEYFCCITYSELKVPKVSSKDCICCNICTESPLVCHCELCYPFIKFFPTCKGNWTNGCVALFKDAKYRSEKDKENMRHVKRMTGISLCEGFCECAYKVCC